jgi:hypothetical protein
MTCPEACGVGGNVAPDVRFAPIVLDGRFAPILLKKSSPALGRISKTRWCTWRFGTLGTHPDLGGFIQRPSPTYSKKASPTEEDQSAFA